MKVKSNLFLKSFAISFLIFFLIAAIVLTNLYMTRIAVDPENRESNILIGLTHNGEVVSLALLHCDPKDKTVTFLAIPDLDRSAFSNLTLFISSAFLTW